jgi:hypothetical protein
MRRRAAIRHVPDYEPRETARSRVSKLAVVALLFSLIASPLVMRFLPYQLTTRVIRTAGIGVAVFAVPAVLSVVVSLIALRRLRRCGASLTGSPLVAAALLLSTLSILFYVAFTFVVLGPGD